MEIIEYNMINCSENLSDEGIKVYGCRGDCWSDDDSCPNFCDHEWGT